MKADGSGAVKADGGAAAASWAGQRERSNLLALRFMRWVAVAAGRRAARLMLHPIAFYFFLASRAVRGHSRRYLDRALGRPATGRDVYRHFHAFCATVLDRVYLLRGQFDEFSFAATGIEAILEPTGRGEGVLACGAHLGSFEALRMVGHDKGLKVAMIMYEDNARLINDTLAAIAPNAELHTIRLGRLDAMLSLRRWLDDGGLAGMLADRTLPGNNPQRSKTVVLPFLGAPARFAELADFSTASAEQRDALIGTALARYVATLEALCREAPYNWFNFFDFWADADADSRP